jgi:hypothetical protein
VDHRHVTPEFQVFTMSIMSLSKKSAAGRNVDPEVWLKIWFIQTRQPLRKALCCASTGGTGTSS